MAYARKVSYTAGPPPFWDGRGPLAPHQPPVPTEAAIRASLLYQTFLAARGHGPSPLATPFHARTPVPRSDPARSNPLRTGPHARTPFHARTPHARTRSGPGPTLGPRSTLGPPYSLGPRSTLGPGRDLVPRSGPLARPMPTPTPSRPVPALLPLFPDQCQNLLRPTRHRLHPPPLRRHPPPHHRPRRRLP